MYLVPNRPESIKVALLVPVPLPVPNRMSFQVTMRNMTEKVTLKITHLIPLVLVVERISGITRVALSNRATATASEICKTITVFTKLHQIQLMDMVFSFNIFYEETVL